ncbi:hypothetical protein C8Q79DRAFT_92821 [Trametes meyenii]|nr:hypothetical protein C8Q79DRAFT_92821 [Trametes meyenii]
MNRHHPYGGYDGPRRGGPGGGYGPGPDRSHHYDRGGAPRGRGFGRGRSRGGGQGSYGSYGGGYDNAAPYNQGPPQGDMGGYNNYQSGPPQDQYYQNGNYGTPGPGQYTAPEPSGGYDQSFDYEDGAGQSYNQGGGHGRFQQKRPQRRERDDKVHDSIIEERIQRERPCRTLFIRNIKYETSSDDVRLLFEEHGEIKTFFDLIANRGMVFVTFFDLRAAERARDRLQGSEISGRPIDVHYSLPRDDHGKGADRQREQELQGTLLVTLRNSASNQPIDDGEVQRKFQQFGDVKSVRPAGDRPDQCYVEFYDTRACEEAHERLRHQGLQDGVMEIVFASSGTDDPQGPGASPQRNRDNLERQQHWEEPTSNRGHRGGRGGRGRGRGRGYGGDNWEDRRDWNNNRDRNASHEDEFGRAQRGGDHNNNRSGNRNSRGGYGGAGPSTYGGAGSGGSGPYGQATDAPAEAADERERLEQAKKVQQLLAALKQPQGGGAPTTSAPPPPPAPPAVPQMSPTSVPPTSQYYGQPPMGLQAQTPSYTANVPPAPAPNPYASLPPQASTPQPPQAASATSVPGLPASILALLQQGHHTQQPSAQAGAPPSMPPYSMPPASAMIGAQQAQQQHQSMPGMPSQNPSQPGYQQLMAFLSQKR